MVDKNFEKDLQKLVNDGLIKVDSKGEMKLTDEGFKQSQEVLDKPGARSYMKQVAKHFNENEPSKESININEISDEIDMIDNVKINIYERFNIPPNDDLKNYQLFCKILDVEKDKEFDKDANQLANLFNIQYELFKEAKYFEIPNNINLLLSNTKNKIRKVNFPHYFSFLDVKLVVFDRTYYSFFIMDMRNLSRKYEEEGGESPKKIERVNILTFYSEPDGNIGYDNFDLYEKDKKKHRNKIREYLINFVDFVNNEDVKLMFRERTERNTERRIQRGKLPIPKFNKIYVIGYLKKYLDKLESDELSTRFKHRFWVRGHFRRFLDREKYKKLYQAYKKGELKNVEGKKYKVEEGFLKVWIFPHIRGEGMLIKQGYKLE